MADEWRALVRLFREVGTARTTALLTTTWLTIFFQPSMTVPLVGAMALALGATTTRGR